MLKINKSQYIVLLVVSGSINIYRFAPSKSAGLSHIAYIVIQ